ncbi:MAG: peptidoglycan editing factor PgeF [Acidocella sp.]|nr:peptidoglycan editing factor PgeF [Acidocella sp.]
MSLHPFTATLPACHGFFTRQGGVSTGSYNSLNCSLSGADALANVLQNRSLVAEKIGVAPENLLGVKQIHGTGVITATTAWAIGQGGEADALVTATHGLAIGVVTADCAPVLFSDTQGSIIGAAHAGWRGAVSGVLEATVAAMQKLGAKTILAAVGPCIHQQSYEVAADLRDAVLAQNPGAEKFFNHGRPARWQFDLPGYCAARLRTIGVTTEIMPHDTCADEINFFSHRRRTLRNEPAIGHQISVIRL